MLLALLLAVAAPAKPWLEMQAGPMLLRGGGSGPLLRITAGQPFGDRLAGEFWLIGALENSPASARGDSALVGAGVGGRLLVRSFGAEDKLGLWARAGVGWSAPAAGNGNQGPSAFGGLMLAFQPFVKRFTVGLEGDALAFRTTVGFALLPSLRCSF
jgi:hypothetical protein